MEHRAAVTAALELANCNYPVFPLTGKRPLTSRGLHDATTDRLTIERWWTRIWPDANLGVRTGNGLLVLDVDGQAGADTLHELEVQHKPLPQTVSVVTGGGGQHYYLHTPVKVRNSAGLLGPGLDVRADGGYVVAPPSVHPDTRAPYEWDNHPADVSLAATPAWLLDRMRDDKPRKPTPANEWARLLDRIPEGERNHSLTRLVGYLLARGLDARVVTRLALSVNETACKPPLPAGEVTRIVESISGRELRKSA